MSSNPPSTAARLRNNADADESAPLFSNGFVGQPVYTIIKPTKLYRQLGQASLSSFLTRLTDTLRGIEANKLNFDGYSLNDSIDAYVRIIGTDLDTPERMQPVEVTHGTISENSAFLGGIGEIPYTGENPEYAGFYVIASIDGVRGWLLTRTADTEYVVPKMKHLNDVRYTRIRQVLSIINLNAQKSVVIPDSAKRETILNLHRRSPLETPAVFSQMPVPVRGDSATPGAEYYSRKHGRCTLVEAGEYQIVGDQSLFKLASTNSFVIYDTDRSRVDVAPYEEEFYSASDSSDDENNISTTFGLKLSTDKSSKVKPIEFTAKAKTTLVPSKQYPNYFINQSSKANMQFSKGDICLSSNSIWRVKDVIAGTSASLFANATPQEVQFEYLDEDINSVELVTTIQDIDVQILIPQYAHKSEGEKLYGFKYNDEYLMESQNSEYGDFVDPVLYPLDEVQFIAPDVEMATIKIGDKVDRVAWNTLYPLNNLMDKKQWFTKPNEFVQLHDTKNPDVAAVGATAMGRLFVFKRNFVRWNTDHVYLEQEMYKTAMVSSALKFVGYSMETEMPQFVHAVAGEQYAKYAWSHVEEIAKKFIKAAVANPKVAATILASVLAAYSATKALPGVSVTLSTRKSAFVDLASTVPPRL